MQQVLFTIPVFKNTFPPDGIPMYGFGAMLFVCFVAVTVWGSRRARRTAGMPPEKFQDMVIWLFVAGIVGARMLYMVQYRERFPDTSVWQLAGAFFKIWEGGIIFYGSALGGVIGYGLFYWFVLRRFEPHVPGWRLADAVAPLLALGLAVGRIGCYLNGCCWGQVACEECRPVPLGAAHFPLLPAHARPLLVGDIGDGEELRKSRHLETATGFVYDRRSTAAGAERELVVTGVEAGSAAERAGVGAGDRIVAVNGEPTDGRDRLQEVVLNWPRGKSKLELTVARGGERVPLPAFAPTTIGLYPTQLYETVSMALLILLLLAYYPYRRHDGQLMVLLMAGYGVHRFINESLRIEPAVGGGLTLSQWGSVVILAAAAGIEIYLRRTMPSRWTGDVPPASEPAPAPPAPPAEPSPAPQPGA